ncbi:MAG: hypothetical protein P4L57_00685 [Rhizomicrobium sp.]|nr:hypothetical protein [Rhizomicrobium sp.]
MQKIILALALASLTSVAANATTWVATCNDGKALQYVQTVKGDGFLYLMVNKELYQTARLTQTVEGEATICGTVVANVAATTAPLTQVCINKSRQTISLKYQDPHAAGGSKDVGEFCAASVILRATNLTTH